MRKRTVIILVIVLAALAVAGYFGYRYFFGDRTVEEGEGVYVMPVASLSGGSAGGSENRFAGVVEPQATWSVNQNPDSTVKEVKVKVGDTVKNGDVLFVYNVETYETAMATAELELERMNNEKESITETIAQLEKDKAKASSADQANYTIQIQQQNLDLKEKEFDIESKQGEIVKLKENIGNAEVKSQIDGVVKTINSGGNANYYGSDSDNSFITIMKTGDLRVKASVNEQNIGEIYEGATVLVISRVDPDQTWTGSVSSIDMENTESSGTDFYGAGDSYSTSSSHPFYVDLDTSEGLMIGQHVYVRLDDGMGETEKTGIWLAEDLIDRSDEEHPFVWAEDKNGRIEKRSVTLGKYDEETLEYEIMSGLSLSDSIAFPEEGLKEGRPVARETGENMGDDAADPGIGTEPAMDDFEMTDDMGEVG